MSDWICYVNIHEQKSDGRGLERKRNRFPPRPTRFPRLLSSVFSRFQVPSSFNMATKPPSWLVVRPWIKRACTAGQWYIEDNLQVGRRQLENIKTNFILKDHKYKPNYSREISARHREEVDIWNFLQNGGVKYGLSNNMIVPP